MKKRLLRAGKYGATNNPIGLTTAPGLGPFGAGGVRIFQASIDCEEDETGKSICLVIGCTADTDEPIRSSSVIRALVTWGSADGGSRVTVDCRQGARVNLEAAQTVMVEAQVIGAAPAEAAIYQFSVAVLEGTIALPRPNSYTEAPYFQGGANPAVVRPIPAYAKALAVLPDIGPGAAIYTLKFWRSRFDFFVGGQNCGMVEGIGAIPVAFPFPVPNVATFYSLQTSGATAVQFTPIFELQI
jgi:hypothetical protein